MRDNNGDWDRAWHGALAKHNSLREMINRRASKIVMWLLQPIGHFLALGWMKMKGGTKKRREMKNIETRNGTQEEKWIDTQNESKTITCETKDTKWNKVKWNKSERNEFWSRTYRNAPSESNDTKWKRTWNET
jgi:hypothetical protein